MKFGNEFIFGLTTRHFNFKTELKTEFLKNYF